MKLCAVLLLLAAAQVPAPPPIAAPGPPAPDLAASALPPLELSAADLLAFTERDSRMTLPVTIADSGPHDFIVDTGSERTVIARELATSLGLAAGRNVRITAMANRVSVPTAIIPSLWVGTRPGATTGALGGSRIEAPALALGHLGASGLLGLDSLQGRALTIDFDRNEMRVAPAIKGKRAVPRAREDEIVIVAKSVLGQLVLADAAYRGRRIRVVLDTGSSISVGNLAFRGLVRPGVLHPISLLSVTGAQLAADYTQVQRVTLGDITLENLPVAFADSAVFARLGLVRQPALLLGMDALRLFRRVEIDFANRRVRLALPRDLRRG